MGTFTASKAGTKGVNPWVLTLEYNVSRTTTAITISLKLSITDNTGEAYNNYTNSAYYKLGQGAVSSIPKQYFTYSYSSKGTYQLGTKTLTITDPTITSVTVSGAWHSIETEWTPGDITVTGDISFAALDVPLTVSTISNFNGTAGQKKTWTVTASGGKTPYTYQWYLKSDSTSTAISGETSASYTRTMAESDSGKYIYCIVKDSSSTVKSATTNEASLIVGKAPVVEQVNFVQVYNGTSWIMHIPWVYTDEGWRVCRWMTLTGSGGSAIAGVAIVGQAIVGTQ